MFFKATLNVIFEHVQGLLQFLNLSCDVMCFNFFPVYKKAGKIRIFNRFGVRSVAIVTMGRGIQFSGISWQLS